MAVTLVNNVLRMTADNDTISRSEQFRISSIIWSGGANTEAMILEDADGEHIVEAVATTGQLEFSWTYPMGRNVGKTITAETLDGGKLAIVIMD